MDRNAYIDKCLAEMAKERALAQAVAVANLKRAREDAKFLELDQREKEIIFSLGKIKATNKKSAQLESDLAKIRKEKDEILKGMGLSAADLEPKYACEKCGDLGYLKGGMCECLKRRVNEMVLSDCGGGRNSLRDFKDFNENIIRSESHKTMLLKIKKKLENLVESFPDPDLRFILISGKPGTGKTFIAECFSKALIEKGVLVSFITAFGMNNLFWSYHTTFDAQKQSYLNVLLDPDVLVIDDLGTEPVLKNTTVEYLLLMLSERSRMGKLTLITSNLGPNELLARYHERIFSRLMNKRESLTLLLEGDDLRIS